MDVGLGGGDVMEGWALWLEVVMVEKEACEAWPRTGREDVVRKGGGAPAMVAGSRCRVGWCGVKHSERTRSHVSF